MKFRLYGVFFALIIFTACGTSATNSALEDGAPVAVGGSTRRDTVASNEIQFLASDENSVTAVMQTNKGDITFVLFPEYAPLAVENFCRLAQQGYYDGTLFHRVVQDFAIQAGKAADGSQDQSIWGTTPFATERSNFLHHYSGALCMAPVNEEADSNFCQFYIVATPQNSLDEDALQKLRNAGMRESVIDTYRQAGGAPYLDYQCTVFGQVTKGMDVVDNIARTSANDDQTPKNDITVQKITINNYS